jgi:hypothetical protein
MGSTPYILQEKSNKPLATQRGFMKGFLSFGVLEGLGVCSRGTFNSAHFEIYFRDFPTSHGADDRRVYSIIIPMIVQEKKT